MKSTRRVLNFTSRKTIDLSRVQVIASNDGPEGFLQVVKLDLSGFGIPDGCPVILEAMNRRDGKIRMELGVTPQPELSRKLKVDPIFFTSVRVRLNVLDASGSGKIVASVEGVNIDIPETSGLRSLLPTLEVTNLVHRLWRMRIDGEGFCLEVNKNFPSISEVVRSSEFYAIVMPDVIRQIAISINDEQCPVPEVLKIKWERLFDSVYRDHQDLKNSEPENWADEVAEALAGRHSLIIRYQNNWSNQDDHA
jgi:hypothetical protein